MTPSPAPVPLQRAVKQWKAAGAQAQPSSRWSPDRWKVRFPDFAEYLAALPQPLSRNDVTARCRAASEGPEQATKAFIAAMIWGYGPVGYGAYRTKRVLTVNDGAAETLAAVAGIARDQGGPDAFEWLARRPNRLHYLGVAFATKYLFFCAANGHGQPALVLDRLVRDWMAQTLAWPLNLEWDVDDYRAYVDRMSAWAGELDIEPGDLEMLVFQLAANGNPQSLWSAPDLFAAAPAESSSPGGVEMASDASRVGDLFTREPINWGLRGDPYVWVAMREKLADAPMPSNWSDLHDMLRTTFRDVVGVDLDESSPDTVYIERFAPVRFTFQPGVIASSQS
jgi:hypothetical protein